MKIKNLIMFDFSGTLSIDSALFALDENLINILKKTGLWDCGLNSPEKFWKEMVNPTWNEGSTSNKGYKKIIYEQLKKVVERNKLTKNYENLKTYSNDFVTSYYNYSKIDFQWKKILQRMIEEPLSLTLIVTDHYFEATEHIINELNNMGIDSASLLKQYKFENKKIIIANSAEIGYAKCNINFWKIIRNKLNINKGINVILIDDFGFNEIADDNYPDKKRSQDIFNSLTTIFNPFSIIFFFFKIGIKKNLTTINENLIRLNYSKKFNDLNYQLHKVF